MVCCALSDLLFPALAVLTAAAPALDPAPAFPRVELKDLFHVADHQDEIPWRPLRDGIDIYALYGGGGIEPTAALIRFRTAGKVPSHLHAGYEHILVLAGSQRDQNGTIEAGTLMINPPGTAHSVVSEAGCIVLAIYEKPVKFLESAGEPNPRQ